MPGTPREMPHDSEATLSTTLWHIRFSRGPLAYTMPNRGQARNRKQRAVRSWRPGEEMSSDVAEGPVARVAPQNGMRPTDMKPTDIKNPDYFHKVVDCQWACPAHTPVPEYIRMIAAGRYSDAYMVNWWSNVFPGILGRTCDRPCEPACRRGRVEKDPVAICRLKRVAADNKDDIRDRLPKARGHEERQAHCADRLRAGVADGRARSAAAWLHLRDLRFRQDHRRHDAHADSEIPLAGNRAGRRSDLHHRSAARNATGRAHQSMKALLTENYDAIFVGCGAPRGRELEIPGRKEAGKNIHIGIDWLASVSFGHTTAIGRRVIVLGGGNTAMDCCRTASSG